jgi:hypothetical protein
VHGHNRPDAPSVLLCVECARNSRARQEICQFCRVEIVRIRIDVNEQRLRALMSNDVGCRRKCKGSSDDCVGCADIQSRQRQVQCGSAGVHRDCMCGARVNSCVRGPVVIQSDSSVARISCFSSRPNQCAEKRRYMCR